jgi:hypothetical protein
MACGMPVATAFHSVSTRMLRSARACLRVSVAVGPVAVCCACELAEITVATPEDIIVAEVILRAGENVQQALLQGTLRTAPPSGAAITVRDETTGAVLKYFPGSDSTCLLSESSEQANASHELCYFAPNASDFVQPRRRYSLRIEVENRVMTAQVEVPGTFQLVRPAAQPCSLRPHHLLELVWTRASGAWVYVADGNFTLLRQALRREGVPVSGNDPVELTGLSVSGTDTTLIFPREIGLFDRFDADLHPIVLALQDGLPYGVFVDLVMGAGDRNYVNWVRGGAFNPSGQVRIPSITGDGTGVFGALVPVRLAIQVDTAQVLPPCG